MDRLRFPLLIAALICFLLAVAAEIGATWFGVLRGAAGVGDEAPGLGIPSLAALDGLLAFTAILMALPRLVGDRLHGRIQGVATLIVSILVLIAAFLLALKDLVLLAIMVSLLLAAPSSPAPASATGRAWSRSADLRATAWTACASPS